MRGLQMLAGSPVQPLARVSAVVRCCTGDTCCHSTVITTTAPHPSSPPPDFFSSSLLFFFFSPHFRLAFKPGRFSSSFFLPSFSFSLFIATPPSSSSLQFYTHHGHRWTGKTRQQPLNETLLTDTSDHQLQSKTLRYRYPPLSHTKSNRRPSLGVPVNHSPSRTSKSLPPRPTRFAFRFTTPVSATRVRPSCLAQGNIDTDNTQMPTPSPVKTPKVPSPSSSATKVPVSSNPLEKA